MHTPTLSLLWRLDEALYLLGEPSKRCGLIELNQAASKSSAPVRTQVRGRRDRHPADIEMARSVLSRVGSSPRPHRRPTAVTGHMGDSELPAVGTAQTHET